MKQTMNEDLLKVRLDLLQAELDRTQTQLRETQAKACRLAMIVTAMESSKFWKLRNSWFRLKRRLGLPTKPELEVGIVEGLDHLDLYTIWMERNFPKQADLNSMAEAVEALQYTPLISIVMPVYDPPETFLVQAIESVLNQVYPYWEFCIADDASTQPHVRSILEKYAAIDSRFKVTYRRKNGHISAASNSALELATGEFVALLDHDDLLTPDALYEVASLLNQHSEADMIYSDEDKITVENEHREPFFKPEWCPDSFLSRMYTCHLGVYRRRIINEIGGFRVGYEGGQDHDLVLRFTEKTDRIFHIPKILYHWRIHSNSTAGSLSSKAYAEDAGARAVAEALSRRGENGTVVPIMGGCRLVRYEVIEKKLVSIIIPSRDLGKTLDRCLESIFSKTQYPNYEVLLLDNGSQEQLALKVIQDWLQKEPKRFRSERLDIPFNYSRINNYGVHQVQGDYLLFLNNDTEVITPDWVDAMVEQAQRPSIGAVGALLLYPDNTVQHAGIICVGGVANHSHKHFPADAPGYFYQIQTINNYPGVTAACLMCRREVFEEVGGFEEDLAVAFNDVDFCFKLLTQGYRNVYLPHVRLYHYESKTRGHDDTPQKLKRFHQEVDYMERKWKEVIKRRPCYSPHLTDSFEDYRIRI